MEEHEVQIVKVEEIAMRGEVEVSFQAIYEYCSRADELLETEDLIRRNTKVIKAAGMGKE